MIKNFLSRYGGWAVVALFFVVAALLYLPFATHAGYYDDDWFAMYAGKVAGPQIFHEFYVEESRPGREWVVATLYRLFHGVPFYYALSAYLFRTLGALTMLWLLRLLWPRQEKATLLAALLFLIYPGFLSQPTPVDFQSYLIGIWIAFLSLACTVKSLLAPDRSPKILFGIGAILTGWLYLSQIEYYIGFEAVRILLILLLFLRQQASWRQTVLSTFKAWLPYAIIPLTFLIWRLFFFESARKATDLGLQLGSLTATPLHTSLAWLLTLAQDIVNVTVLAWTVPLSELAFNLDLYNSVIALGLSILVLALFFFFFLRIHESAEDIGYLPNFGREALWLGAAWAVFGLIPVILGNRHVTFLEYSRYALVSSGGAAILLVALFGRLSGRWFQHVVIALLLVSATFTHYANAVRFAAQMDNIRSFWWQVSWRVPQFDKGTTIVAHYPVAAIREQSFVWGPANQIYFPTRLKPDTITPGIASILLNRDTVMKILNKEKQYMDSYYAVTAYPNPRHITILTQPTPRSCVQVIDGAAPEFSREEDPMFLLIGPYSETEKILTEGKSPAVPQALFGSEPAHDWCYYYEKAALARQRGDWQAVLQLADEATKKNLKPSDLIEWMPFLQAYASKGQADEVAAILQQIQSDEYISRQACQSLDSLEGDPNIQSLISAYCVPQ